MIFALLVVQKTKKEPFVLLVATYNFPSKHITHYKQLLVAGSKWLQSLPDSRTNRTK